MLTVPSETMGRGDGELGQVLIRAFFHRLGEIGSSRTEGRILVTIGVPGELVPTEPDDK